MSALASLQHCKLLQMSITADLSNHCFWTQSMYIRGIGFANFTYFSLVTCTAIKHTKIYLIAIIFMIVCWSLRSVMLMHICIKDEHSYSGSDLCYCYVYSNHGIIIILFFTTFRKKVSYYWTCCQSMWMSVVETSLAFQWSVLLTHQLYRDRNRCSCPHSTRHRWVSGREDVAMILYICAGINNYYNM